MHTHLFELLLVRINANKDKEILVSLYLDLIDVITGLVHKVYSYENYLKL